MADFAGNGCNVLGCGTATSADDIHQTFFGKLSYCYSHFFRSLRVASHTVGESGIRMAADSTPAITRHLTKEGKHLCRSERTVETNTQHIDMFDAGEESPDRLP